MEERQSSGLYVTDSTEPVLWREIIDGNKECKLRISVSEGIGLLHVFDNSTENRVPQVTFNLRSEAKIDSAVLLKVNSKAAGRLRNSLVSNIWSSLEDTRYVSKRRLLMSSILHVIHAHVNSPGFIIDPHKSKLIFFGPRKLPKDNRSFKDR